MVSCYAIVNVMDTKNYTPISTASSTDNYENITVEIQKLEGMLHKADIPHDLWEKANMQLQRINLTLRYGGNINQLDMLVKYVEWITELPWAKRSKDLLDIEAAKRAMNDNHYGLDKIKARVLEYISVLMLQEQKKELGRFHAPVLFFVGLAGTGKTTFARSIAEALGRQFARIPFGGLSSALDLRGMSKVQPEAEPGQILKALRRVGTKNPVILLDELDRIAPSAQGEIMGVLLELLDPEQNGHFIDHYVDYPFDLSEVIFVATANNTRSISTAVLDRLEIIQMPSYTDEEKIHIASHYLLPRLLNDSGMAPDALQVEDPVWKHVARLSGYDPGIRSVERKVESMVRNAAFRTVTGKGQKFVISEGNAKEFIEE